MKSPHFHIRCRQGAALVVTLLIVVLITTILVAYMQLVDAEKGSSLAVANRYRATLAAQAGLADFMAKLNSVAESGDFTVVEAIEEPDPNNPDALPNKRYTSFVKFTAEGKPYCIPLASYPPLQPDVSSGAQLPIKEAPYDISAIFKTIDAVVGAGNKTLNLVEKFRKYGERDPTKPEDLEAAYAIEYPTANPRDLVLNAQFVPMFKNASAEFAYVAVDESAKLNMAVFGSEYKGEPRIQEEVASFPKEVAVAESGNHTVAMEQLQEFQNLDPGLKTGPVWKAIFPTPEERFLKKQFYTSHKGQVVDYIPFGHLTDNRTGWSPFVDGGKPKYDLNKLATEKTNSQENAFKIADVIDKNLPNWRRRDISLVESKLLPSNPTLRYPRRIAASIVDYIDNDNEITLLEDEEPAGQELTAYPFKIAERYDWIGAVKNPNAGGAISMWTLSIRHTLFVEMWNPYTVPVSGKLDFELETLREYGHPTPDDNSFNIPKISGSADVNLKPNEINVYKISEKTFTVSLPGGDSLTDDPIISLDTTSKAESEDADQRRTSRFKARWNGSLYSFTPNDLETFDSRGPGLQKRGSNLEFSANSSKPNWQCNVPQVVRVGETYRSVGDPRVHHINNYVWTTFSYTGDGSRFKGAFNSNNGTQSQHYNLTWIRRDGVRTFLPAGNRPANVNINPDELASNYVETTDALNAVAYLRNGAMETIAELGHIFDPASLDDFGNNPGTAGTPNSYFGMAGGRTLRIGQPEFNYPSFDKDGQRATYLLDLFTTSKGKGSMQERQSGINLNTAPEEVLSSFFYNISLISDKGSKKDGKYPILSKEGSDLLAQEIIKNRPYYTASDFHRFVTEFVNPDNFEPDQTADANGVIKIMERGREEIFRRAYNFMETKSGAFKVYCIGRVLSSNGKVLSEQALEAQVEWGVVEFTDPELGNRAVIKPKITQVKYL